jgi:RNA polymerase sigma-70 factor (ECF subfamily)
MNEAQSDESLMAAYADRGDVRAFEALFLRFAPSLHRFFQRSFRSSAVADDLLQTTFLKLHGARATYRPGGAVRPWVFAIAARVRIDELRRRYRTPEEADDAWADRADEARLRDASTSGARDRARIVQGALDRLPEQDRVLIHLHRYEGMTFAEIAEVLGTTEGAAKVRAFRAYARLRDDLEPLLGEPR